jgi:hypothetical protein
MLLTLLTVLSLTSLSFSAPTAENCTQATLKAGTDAYVAAQTAGQANFTGLASTVDYLQNKRPADFKTSIISKPLTPDHVKSYYDLVNCSSYTELIITDPKSPHVIGTALRWSGGQIGAIQSIVTTTGDWLFNATGTLAYASKETWTPIPAAQRDTRAVIQAAADAYLDLFDSVNTTAVPWGSPCARLEGGSYITPSCNVGVPSGLDLMDRTYVIDETLGAVDVQLRFGGTRGLPDSHEFRIEGGKIRYVHTMSVQNA